MKCTGKQLVWGFGLLVCSTALATMLCISSASSQGLEEKSTHRLQHTDDLEWEDSIGLMHIEVTELDKRLVYYTRRTIHKVELASFGYDQHTIFPKEFLKHPEGCYFVHYCKKHLIVYDFNPVQCKK